VGSSSSRSRESWDSWISQPSTVRSDRSCTRVTIRIRRIGIPVVKVFLTFETPKPGEDLGHSSVEHVVEIEASVVREIRSPMDRRSRKSIVKTLA
jgi:hypothetical protein